MSQRFAADGDDLGDTLGNHVGAAHPVVFPDQRHLAKHPIGLDPPQHDLIFVDGLKDGDTPTFRHISHITPITLTKDDLTSHELLVAGPLGNGRPGNRH